MARIVREIEVNGQKLKALFDSGSLRSYIREVFSPGITHRVLPLRVGLGGRERILEERCDVIAKLERLEFAFNAYVVDDVGETEHRPVDVLIGALCMEEWYMKLDPRTGELDLSGLRRREFTEFWRESLVGLPFSIKA